MLHGLLSVWWQPDHALPAALGETTVRTVLAIVLSFAVAMALGPRLIRWLEARFREPLKHDSQRLMELHQAKQWTPTMGGLLLIAAMVSTSCVLADGASPIVQQTLLLVFGLGAIGAWDDLTKLRSSRRGISARAKLAAQLLVATLVSISLYQTQSVVDGGLVRAFPWIGAVDLGWWFVPLAVLVIVGMSNAVNLTDGLDGLAAGCVLLCGLALGLVAYASVHGGLAEYLHVRRIEGANELPVIVGSLVGAVLGFLWFNCHPARVFMGDTGSLPLGGLLGLVAVMLRQELLLLVVGGVFVAEAASVVLQVGSYKLRRKRIFLCAPLHHHFQFAGWAEATIVVRFWIAAVLCALLGIAGLRWQHPDVPQAVESMAAIPKPVDAQSLQPSRRSMP